MMAPGGSNGDEGPTSTTKPIFLPVLFHVTVVPAFTQKSALLLGFDMLAVEDAAFAVRFTSTVQGVEPDPHVLPELHSCAGFGSEQAYRVSSTGLRTAGSIHGKPGSAPVARHSNPTLDSTPAG
jgi:hypothetical protein